MTTDVLSMNKRIKDVVGSTTLAITARAKELQAQGRDVVNFAGGEPDFDTPEHIKQAGIQAIQKGITKYTPSTGTAELRDAIAEKFRKENNLIYKPNQIAVGCGAKHAIYNVVQVLVDDGEEVIIPAPYWVSYPEMVKMAGGVPRFVQTSRANRFKITADQIKKAATPRTKLLILNSPSNPTGVVYSRQDLEAIAEVCVKNRIYVISDEIYEKLIYESGEYVSIGALGKEIFDLTITVNGVSKAYAMTGWRIGYAAGPQEIMDYVKKFQDHATSNPASISQVAALQAMKSPAESIDAMREEFKRRRDAMMAAVDKIPQLSYIRPDGAFYLFCDFSKVGASEDLAKRILDEINVALIPGDGFGAPGFLRLSFSTSQERIQEGISRISGWIAKNAR